MDCASFRRTTLSLAALALLALPAMAADIPAGPDFWRTEHNGSTFFTFPGGEVESLCGAPASDDWDHVVRLGGVPVTGDADTIIQRLKDANFVNGVAQTQVMVRALHFKSTDVQDTPCGPLVWEVKNTDDQPITKMVIRQTSEQGGTFNANISVRVVFSGYNANSGAFLGNLFYTFDLPDTTAGTPWSFDPSGAAAWRPGMSETEDCTEVLRAKALTLPARHGYFIADMIAQGRCTKER
ncbi:MAG TPA: hypothetical protein VF017_11525 [Thermoanaerobaculia bacterium]|nr:hypothetical protein [Thermoanaerobaculia bacterium]